jgi:hypothetical protein
VPHAPAAHDGPDLFRPGRWPHEVDRRSAGLALPLARRLARAIGGDLVVAVAVAERSR